MRLSAGSAVQLGNRWSSALPEKSMSCKRAQPLKLGTPVEFALGQVDLLKLWQLPLLGHNADKIVPVQGQQSKLRKTEDRKSACAASKRVSCTRELSMSSPEKLFSKSTSAWSSGVVWKSDGIESISIKKKHSANLESSRRTGCSPGSAIGAAVSSAR